MKIRVSPSLAIIDIFLCVLIPIYLLIQTLIGLDAGERFLAIVYLLLLIRIIRNDKEYLALIRIHENQITSSYFLKERCVVSFSICVYISFFQEEIRSAPNEKYHVMVSNSPIPDFEPNTRFEAYDRSKQIIFPDTEKTRQAIAPLLASEFCILQGDDPPPVEELRKKKEKKEEPPVVKREKSPDDPPPFTGKWNGRF